MDFFLMNESHIEEALTLAMEQYREECRFVPSLSDSDFSGRIRKSLTDMLEKETGLVAMENGKVLGYMIGFGPIEGFFGRDTGMFIPVEGHGAIKERRLDIYGELFREGAKYWATKGIFSIAVAHYVHDEEVKEWFYINGFGARCMDAMTRIEDVLGRYIHGDGAQGITIQPAVEKDYPRLFELTNLLVDHLRQSPVFFPLRDLEYEKFLKDVKESEANYMVAKDGDRIIGHIKYVHDGEECFATYHPSISNICGAFLEPDYRGQGIFSRLLVSALKDMKDHGKTRCGVDCETINPEAYRFWTKYFEPYTFSVFRRLDERSQVKDHNIKV